MRARRAAPVWSDVDVCVARRRVRRRCSARTASGKSTLLKALLGLLPLARGSGTVLGRRAGRRPNGEIGYLPQRRSFDAAARIRGVDVVRLGLDGDRWGVPLPLPLGAARGARGRRASG